MLTKAVSEWEQKIAAIDQGTQGNWQIRNWISATGKR
jgi:hypothetical protein